MTTSTTAVRRARLTWGDGATALAAVGVGAFGAFAYYGDTILRPFAHTFGIWLFLVAVVSARQTLLRGALRGGGALLLGVVAFFYGKQIYYDILYPGPGFPTGCNRSSSSSGECWGCSAAPSSGSSPPGSAAQDGCPPPRRRC